MDSPYCNVVFKYGKRKGLVCGALNCGIHGKNGQKLKKKANEETKKWFTKEDDQRLSELLLEFIISKH